LEEVANEVISSAAETTSGSLKLSEGELLIENYRGNAIAKSTEGFQARRNNSTLP
jgi:hypothetical protein